PWLQVISRLNPLSYQVDALRALMLVGGTSSYGLAVDYAVLSAVSAVLVFYGGRLYPRVAV
ncbi:MAG TPA: multidrug ABC transporter permease, partial [Anaerolineae bacterium]|nr:multidrug ABC transporter permease [Anaerolineae bacterium]